MDLHGRKQLSSSPEVAMANQVFDQFCNAATLKSILGHFRHLCELLNVRSNTISQFYPKLKAKLRSWKAQALWKKFDQRANHKCYNRGKACLNTRVLIIGGGPCGLRSAIEAQLLGAKVVVVEKRDRMSRNNVLHLWPFVIQDLRGLGAKKFFGKFCAGSIDHISIRQLQCILLKVALILGVEFHENVSFDSLIEPPDEQGEGKIGWRAKTTPADHPVSQYEFDVLIGADGKRNTLEGFKRKEFRGKLAIAITANFINKRTEAEARVEEISGVAFIFNQKFFKELHQETGIDLENIVYYKDDTHYFVMTAKKHSLIDKGVILQDHPDTAKLLAKENVDREALMLYAREAAEFSTEYQMMDMEFAVNHYGQPDVAMFDFTSMYAAENASRVLERHGHRLLMILVGDSLLEPFWPTGSGCARGFLSSLDACWAIKGWGGSPMTPLEVIAERESIYRLLGQTTPENLNRDYAAYTLDPHTRYPNLNVRSVTPIQVRSLLDTDDPDSIKQPTRSEIDIPKKRRRRDFRAEAQVNPETLLRWLQRQVALYDSIHVEDMGASFRDGMAICAIIHRYRPDLLDFHRLQVNEVAKNNQLAFDILDKELGISPIMTGEEMAQSEIPDKLVMFSYLTQIYEAFRGEIPHIKHPKLEPDSEEKPNYSKQISQLTPEQKAQLIGRIAKESVTRMRRSRHSNDNLQSADKKGDTIGRRSRKRRSTEKMGATVEERQRRLEEIEKNRVERMRKRQYLRKMATQQFYKSMQMLQANAKREKDEPFEDYSLFVYRQTAPDFKDRVKYLEQKILYPDREPKIHAGHLRGNVDEEFSGRIKSFEDKLRGSTTTEKKPKDLLRAIGKIEKTDWNVKEIEKKIEENKMGRGVRHDKIERVPKWSREQFLARQIKMEKKGRDPKESDGKYADIDHTLKTVDRKIKEGNVLGYNKVSAMAEQFSNKNQDTEMKIQKSNSRAALALPAQGGSEMCHFCNKRVYLMERLSAEGKYFHRGCFRCEYCSTSLRIGNHTFDREKEGGRFYCTQHFGLSGTMKGRAEKKRNPVLTKENLPNLSTNLKSPEKDKGSLDLLDRGQTPERIEFENLAGVSDAEEAHSQMDEDEWTDRNFGASAAEMGSSDDISDMSDSDEDNEVYEETMDQPLTTEGTLELAKNWTLRYSHGNPVAGQSDTGSNEYEDSSDDYTSEDEESGTATEDEEDIRARELRKLEVWLKVPPRSSDTDTGSETEVASDDDESSKESEENSATEISTDSEFDHDGVTPTQHEIPEITINDSFVRKTRGNYVEPKKVQVKSKIIAPANSNLRAKEPKEKEENRFSQQHRDYSRKVVEASSKVAEREVAVGTPPRALVNPRKGDYLLNRTHSTEGIASKLSLELKKRYLLGGSGVAGSVMKSGSTSNVDTKLSNFTDAISQHQKLLNPAPEPSPTMQAFLHGTNKLRGNNVQLSPLSPTALLTSSAVRSLSANRNPAISDNETASPYRPTTTRLTPSANKPQEPDDELPDVLPEMPSIIMKSKTAPSIPCAEVAKGDMEKVDAKNLADDPGSSGKKTTEPLDSLQSGDGDGGGGSNDIVASYKICSDEAGAGRPRSPLHEASIIVPTVIWSKSEDENKEASTEDYEIDSDSLSSDSEEAEEEARNERLISHLSPPRLQIHSTEGDLLLDEKMDEVSKDPDLDGAMFEPDSIECSALDEKSCCSPIVADHRSAKERTALEIEAVNNNLEQLELRDDARRTVSDCSSSTSVASAISNKQDDSEDNDVTTAALTETEFSEWARDGEALVSEDLRDAEFDINPEFVTMRKNGRTSDTTNSSVTSTTAIANAMATSCKNAKFPVTTPIISMAKLEDLTDLEFDSSQLEKKADHPRNNATSNLLTNGENIDYMDTDNESLLDDSLQENSNAAVVKNRGYIEFVNIKTTVPSRQMMMMMGKVENAPIAELEGDNSPCSDEEKFNNENVIEINPVTMDDVMNRLNDKRNELAGNVSDANARQDISLESLEKGAFQSMDEDSLLIHEPNEDTTTSEVITILASPVNPQVPMVPMEVENTQAAELPKVVADSSNPDYLEYVKRLQSRIAEFSNAKDSIDVRKSKKKNFKSSIQARAAGIITEEIKKQESPTSDKLTPATTRKLEEIKKERFKEKNLVQDILMDKLEAHKQKSAEKKAKRAARTNSFSCGHVRSGIKPPVAIPATAAPVSPSSTVGQEFVPTSIVSATSTPIHTTFAEAKKALAESLGETPTQNAMDLAQQPRGSATGSLGEPDKRVESCLSKSATDSKLSNFFDAERNFKTPVAPPRLKHEEAKRTAEKARQEARERARLKSDEDLGLSPEDKLKELRKLVARRQHSVEERKRSVQQVPAAEPRVRPNSFILSRPSLRLQTSKSTDNMKNIARKLNYEVLMSPNTKSMDELSHATNSSNLDTDTTTTTTTTSSVTKRDKKKAKDPERRKSIIQAVSDFFFKKDSSTSPNPSPKDKLSMFRISTKTKGKLLRSFSDGSNIDKIGPSKYDARPKSVSEDMILGNYHNEQPPPIPPPPMNYNTSSVQVSDDSLSEEDTCGALSTSGMQRMTLNEDSCNSIPRKLKSKKLARQAQMKRLRMAQEIQRKLEETEVKQRDLESRGVSVEKALRGEGECSEREEADLLREWFDLMKERTELRRYEKELLVRAQEVQLEDRHERLEQELRERLADDDGKKTSADVKKEGEILTEMLEIVAKRDSLIALLEEERQRYQDEERDLEVQMLAKGLRLTPIKKCGPMYSA